MPTPSMTARRMAQVMAPLRIDLKPPRTASDPPVKKPAMIAFQGSSFFRILSDSQLMASIKWLRKHVPLDRAVICREKSSPDAEVASQHWCSRFHGRDCADSPFAVGAISGERRFGQRFRRDDTYFCWVVSDKSLSIASHRTNLKPFTPCQTAPPMALHCQYR